MVNPLTVLWQGALVAGFVLTGLRYLRQRHPESRDVFLMFGTLMGLVLSNWSDALFGVSLGVLTGLLLWAHPFAMLRVIDRFHPVDERVMRAATWALVGGGVLVVGFPSPRPTVIDLPLVAYFVLAEVYAAALLVRGAASSAGATRMRLRLAALGAFLLGVAIFTVIGSNYVPLDPFLESQAPLAMVVVGFASFYVGFAPPRSLGRYWEYQAVHKILDAPADVDAHGDHVGESIEEFMSGVRSLMDPDALVVFLKRGKTWEVEGDIETEALPAELGSHGSLMQRAMQGGSAIVDRDAARVPSWEGELVREHGGTGLAAIPIEWQGNQRGVGLVVLRRLPLFVEQTASFLTLWGRDLARSLGVEALAQKREQERVEALKRERELLREADRVKDEFLATMSHEIRTPMNAVLGTVDLLTDTPLTREQRSYLDTIARSGDHLLTIIDDLLNLSKIEAGKLEINQRPASIETLVEGCIEMAAPKAKAKDLEILHRIETRDADIVWMDPDRIRQILTNLVSNAIKFTDTGHVKVHASLAPPGDEPGLLLKVEDTGIGIPEEKVEAIFDPFQQADASTTREHEGTGLGLAITKRLVDLMDGAISVDSTPEEGTTFRVRIPLEPASDEAVASVQEAKAAEPSTPTVQTIDQNEALKILLVEDNSVNRRVAKELLANLGHDAKTAASGHEALQMLDARGFDVVLLDLQMPGMDGFEVAERIHETHDEAARPKLIALTAHVGPAYRQKAQSVGIDAYLTKPIRREELNDALVHVTGPRNGNGSLPGPDEEHGEQDAGFGTTSAGGHEEQLVDADKVASLQEEISPEGFQDILDMFLAEIPDLLSKLEDESADGDLEAVSRHAHSLKGLALSVGAQRLAALAATLEAAPDEQLPGQPGARLEGLKDAWAKTETRFQELG